MWATISGGGYCLLATHAPSPPRIAAPTATEGASPTATCRNDPTPQAAPAPLLFGGHPTVRRTFHVCVDVTAAGIASQVGNETPEFLVFICGQTCKRRSCPKLIESIFIP
jgi:hypothetical protein